MTLSAEAGCDVSFCTLLPYFAEADKRMASGAGWQYVLRRGCTTTSLSVPGYVHTSPRIQHAMDALRLLDPHLYDLGIVFPKIEQISAGRSRRCLDYVYDPSCCTGDAVPFDTQTYFGPLISNAKVCSSSSSAQAIRTA